MMSKYILFCFLLILIISFFPSELTFSSSSENREDLFLKIGIQPIKRDVRAPDFSLENLKGKKLGLKNYIEKVIFLNFWATWCSPCKEEMPSMEMLYQKFKDKGFVFLAVSVDYEGKKTVKEFIQKRSYTFPVLLDPKSNVMDLYEVRRIPTTIIIDKNRKIIGKAVGQINWNSQDVMIFLNSLLN